MFRLTQKGGEGALPYPRDDQGTEIDARFSVEKRSDGFDLVIASRSGSDHGPEENRNRQYTEGLELHLDRMGHYGMELQGIEVASRPALELPQEDRKLNLEAPYTYPIQLVNQDSHQLRLAIGRASAAYRRESSTGGNPTKKLRLLIGWPEAQSLDARQIEELLAQPPGSGEEPTADPEEFNARVKAARRRLGNAAGRVPGSKPSGQPKVRRETSTSDRFVRDPKVAAWVLQLAQGVCEVCDRSAPFRRSDDGEPFLEVHHVRPLSEGGPDVVENAVGCCPNCHRQLHHGRDREELRQRLIARHDRLQDFPVQSSEQGHER